MAVIQVLPSMMLCKVSEYWDEMRGWKWTKVCPFSPSTTLLKIASITLSNSEEDKDMVTWLSSPKGDFSVRYAHALEAGCSKQGNWKGWKAVWRLKTQQRVRIFLWEPSHSRLLTNEARWQRGLAHNGDCARCCGHLETPPHVVRDCNEAKEVNLVPSNISLRVLLQTSPGMARMDSFGCWVE